MYTAFLSSVNSDTQNRRLALLIYQLDRSSFRNSCIFLTALVRSYISNSSVTSLTKLLYLDKIHLSNSGLSLYSIKKSLGSTSSILAYRVKNAYTFWIVVKNLLCTSLNPSISKLTAPFAPFISEEIYQNLTEKESVHLADFPIANKELIDKDVEEKMDLVRDLVGLGRAARDQAQIKVRQPLQKILTNGKYEDLISDLVPLIKEELNIKEIVFVEDPKEYMNYSLKPDFKVAGPILGSKIKALSKALAQLDASEVVPKLEAGESIELELNGEMTEIIRDYVMITISAKEGFTVQMESNLFVILDTTLTDELIDEGLAREFVSKVQQMRKNAGFEVADNINIYFDGDDDVARAVDTHRDYIMQETLALVINDVKDANFEKQNLNDHDTGIRVERV